MGDEEDKPEVEPIWQDREIRFDVSPRNMNLKQ